MAVMSTSIDNELKYTLNRVIIGDNYRHDKLDWFVQNDIFLFDMDYYSFHGIKSCFKIISCVYLNDEEFMVYKLRFPE